MTEKGEGLFPSLLLSLHHFISKSEDTPDVIVVVVLIVPVHIAVIGVHVPRVVVRVLGRRPNTQYQLPVSLLNTRTSFLRPAVGSPFENKTCSPCQTIIRQVLAILIFKLIFILIFCSVFPSCYLFADTVGNQRNLGHFLKR